MTIRSRAGVLAANVLQIIFGKNRDLARETLVGLGDLWQVGPGRRSNHGFRDSRIYGMMLAGGEYLKGFDITPPRGHELSPTYHREPMPNQWTKWKGVRPAASYRGARRNDEWARKDVGNTKPADRQRLMAEGRV